MPSGLATIRAYGEDAKFLEQNEHFLDIENRAYLLTVRPFDSRARQRFAYCITQVYNQRWLGFRLDFFGALLMFIVAIFVSLQRRPRRD